MFSISDPQIQQTCLRIRAFIDASRVIWLSLLQRLSLSERHRIPDSAAETLETPDLRNAIIRGVRSNQNWINAPVPTNTCEISYPPSSPFDIATLALVMNGRYLMRISACGSAAEDSLTHRYVTVEFDELELNTIESPKYLYSCYDYPDTSLVAGASLNCTVDEVASGILRVSYHIFDESLEKL